MRRLGLATSLLAVLAAASPASAAAEPSVTANPNPIAFGKKLTIKGSAWPVIEFCSRTVRLSLRSDQNTLRIGTDRVTTKGRFRFTWTPRRAEIGRGDWTLVARLRCESGQDGSPNPMRATTPIRIGASRLVVGRGRTSSARWALSARRARGGSNCLALGLRRLGDSLGLRGEHCGPGLRGRPLTMGLRIDKGIGTFAYGMASLDVGRVEVAFGSAPPMEARILPRQPALGFAGRFWIAPFDGRCSGVVAQAFNGAGELMGEAGGGGGDCPAAP